jgi:hypothetical protein
VLEHDIRKGAQVILKNMKKPLKTFPNIVTQKIVLQKVMVNPIVTTLVQNHDTFSKDANIEREFMTKLIQSLSEVKRPYTST